MSRALLYLMLVAVSVFVVIPNAGDDNLAMTFNFVFGGLCYSAIALFVDWLSNG